MDEAGDVALDPPIDRDLEAIKERGTLTILAPYNSTTYFLLRGEPMGYEYELLRSFAREHGLKLVMEVVKNQKSLYQRLNRGEGDNLGLAVARVANVSRISLQAQCEVMGGGNRPVAAHAGDWRRVRRAESAGSGGQRAWCGQVSYLVDQLLE